MRDASILTKNLKPETGNWFRYWLPALAWAALIFLFSSRTFSTAQTGHFLRPFLEWLFGEISDSRFALIHLLVRKAAHLAVYAALSALWFRALRGARPGWKPSWALLALLVGMLVALGDEFHQSFVLSRTGSPWDVLLDSFGAFLAQAVIARFARRRTHSPV
jgi:VanZ family protein